VDIGDRFRFRLEFLGLRGIVAALGRLPPSLGRPTGAVLGRLLRAISTRRVRLSEENLRLAFPEAGDGQIRIWSREIWGHLGQAAWEFARLTRLSADEYRTAVTVRGLEGIQASYAKGKGVLLFSAHMGNWEYAVPFLALGGLRLASVARRIKNPLVDEFVTGVRRRFGAGVILHRNAVRESVRWLRSGGALGLLFDQRITEGGISVPFFGRPARTTGLPALLALRYGYPVHPLHSYRENGRLIIECQPAMDIPSAPPTPENLRSLTRRMTGVVEEWIRRHPSQWLWIHNRWKP